MGPHRYNKKTCDEIYNLISTGVPIKQTCAIVGINRDTYYRWYNNGKEDPESKYYPFYQRMEKAKANAIAARVKRINDAGKAGTWQADAWYLERIDPEHFGRKDKVEVDANAKVENKSFDNLIRAFEESKKQWQERRTSSN